MNHFIPICKFQISIHFYKDLNQTTIVHAGVYIAPGGKIEGGGISSGLIASNVGRFDGHVNVEFQRGKKNNVPTHLNRHRKL